MKNNMLKKLTSALCLVMAMCLTFQSVAFAAEASDLTELPFVAASDTADLEEESSAQEEEASAPEEEEPQETDPADQPETDPADGSASGEESTDPADDSQSGEQSVVEELPAEEEIPVEAMEETQNGWAALKDGTLTFWYWENDTVTAVPRQAQDEVLYLPEDTQINTYLVKAGYYYFDANGALVLNQANAATVQTGVGTVEVLKKDAVTGKFLPDVSVEAQTYAGKMMTVTTTVAEKVNTQGKLEVSSQGVLFTGRLGDIFYTEGELYTGFYIGPSGKLYYITDGVYKAYTGKYLKTSTDTFDGVTYTGNDLYYYNGTLYTGYWYHTNDKVYDIKNGKGGTLLTGVMSKSKYLVKDGKRSYGDGKLYSKGLLFSGVYTDKYYYKNGVKQTKLSGWQTFDSNGKTSSKSSDDTYYFKSGKCVTGWQYLTRNGGNYKFYFYSDGRLCKNLYKQFPSYKKSATKLVISKGTHTATLYANQNVTHNGKSYMVPYKSFVVSTSRKDVDFRVGTYKLTKTKTWFTIENVRWWYKWACLINGSGSWTHSEQYYTKGVHNSLRNDSYNKLGTNQSKQCIRMQVVNAKLIYDMHTGGGYIKNVVLNKSTNKGPFGQMTVTDNVDYSKKLPSGGRGYEPTDPKTPKSAFKA
jgi:hypothetical protein